MILLNSRVELGVVIPHIPQIPLPQLPSSFFSPPLYSSALFLQSGTQSTFIVLSPSETSLGIPKDMLNVLSLMWFQRGTMKMDSHRGWTNTYLFRLCKQLSAAGVQPLPVLSEDRQLLLLFLCTLILVSLVSIRQSSSPLPEKEK